MRGSMDTQRSSFSGGLRLSADDLLLEPPEIRRRNTDDGLARDEDVVVVVGDVGEGEEAGRARR